jgi:D-alanyl-D-alanine carboxypeptidase (penicillin-binding protein 5/6)
VASQKDPSPLIYQDPPEISGLAAAVLDEPCGSVIYEQSAHQRLAPASLTKMATALVAAERAGLLNMVDVQVDGPELAVTTDSTTMGLTPGQRLSMRDLLHGLLLSSGNDAAIAIAEYVGGSVAAFVDLMNESVRELGIGDTHFTNPHGLDDSGLYTSALDIAVIAQALLRDPELAVIVRAPSYHPAWDGPVLWNDNQLLYSYPGAIGVKVGYTDEALQTIVAAAEREGRRLIVSVLGSSTVYGDATQLLDWAFDYVPSLCATPSSTP